MREWTMRRRQRHAVAIPVPPSPCLTPEPRGSPSSSPMPLQRRTSRTTIREIVDPADPALRDAYALLTRAFHRDERVPKREWIGSLQEKSRGLPLDFAWHLLVAERGGRVIGLSSGTYLGNVNLGVIGYLAIAPGLRAQGLGSRMRSRLRRCFARDAERLAQRPLAGVIGEVSEDNPWLRRLAARPEVLLLDFAYFQPGLHEDDEPSPFILYYEALGKRRSRLPQTEIRRILYTVWRRVYRVARPLERPEFRAMLRSLEGRRSIGRRAPTPGNQHDR